MLEAISPILSLLSTAANAIHWFADLRKATKGDVRALIGELEENFRLCERVVEDGVPPEEVIPHFSSKTFDRLNESGFDFNAVQRDKIPAYEGIEKTDLSSWVGKSTQDLICNIYAKLKDMRSIHAHQGQGKRRLGPRIINVHKRIRLLVRHSRK